MSPPWWTSRSRRACSCVAALIAAAAACAGPLEDPERFAYLLDAGGGADAGDGGSDGATPDGGDGGSPDGGEPDGGTQDGGADGGKPDAGGTDGGPGDGGADGGPHDAGCNPVQVLFIPTCATGLCHGADTLQADLDLASPGMPGRLIGKQGYGGPGLIIDPVRPEQSLMLTKLQANPPFNFQMPLGLDPLTPAETACIRSWVFGAVGK
jgi:hypothetical protein